MTEELKRAALEKHRSRPDPREITAVFDRSTRENDQDGQQWRFAVTDGEQVEELEASLAGSQGGGPAAVIDRETVEAAVERRASLVEYDESRMDAIVAASPIALHKEDLRPHPPPSAFP